ncbi:hypothetical protein LP419_31270 [Massilia sp. H-1]|nr:hypothetical protein LP419_31270 [Massilia sp. H-1]
MNHPGWQQAANVLCVRLDSLGDVLMCTPAMRAIKQSCPGRTLSLLTSTGGAAAAPYIPELDAVLRYPAPWIKSSAPHTPLVDAAMVQSLTALQFDAAVIFTSYCQSALPWRCCAIWPKHSLAARALPRESRPAADGLGGRP